MMVEVSKTKTPVATFYDFCPLYFCWLYTTMSIKAQKWFLVVAVPNNKASFFHAGDTFPLHSSLRRHLGPYSILCWFWPDKLGRPFQVRQLFSITIRLDFKNPWKWKWSNEVEKSEMIMIWCISITNNVKSYKKLNEIAQTARFTVFTMCGS